VSVGVGLLAVTLTSTSTSTSQIFVLAGTDMRTTNPAPWEKQPEAEENTANA